MRQEVTSTPNRQTGDGVSKHLGPLGTPEDIPSWLCHSLERRLLPLWCDCERGYCGHSHVFKKCRMDTTEPMAKEYSLSAGGKACALGRCPRTRNEPPSVKVTEPERAGYAQAKGERDGRWPTQLSLSTSSHVFCLFHPTPCWVLGHCAGHDPLSHISPANL